MYEPKRSLLQSKVNLFLLTSTCCPICFNSSTAHTTWCLPVPYSSVPFSSVQSSFRPVPYSTVPMLTLHSINLSAWGCYSPPHHATRPATDSCLPFCPPACCWKAAVSMGPPYTSHFSAIDASTSSSSGNMAHSAPAGGLNPSISTPSSLAAKEGPTSANASSGKTCSRQ